MLDRNPALKFTKEEAKRILKYAQESYFKHLKLYEFVFNNKTASELKRINFPQESAKQAPALSQALQISHAAPRSEKTGLDSTDNEGERIGGHQGNFGDTQV